MSARINKKPRKRIPNPHRERTVTDLTPLGETFFSSTPTVNTSDVELATQNDEQHLLPAFVAASSSTANMNNQSIPPSFGFGFNNFAGGAMHPNVQQQAIYHSQQQQNMQTILPPGKNDLEVLENLKETIKRGQHEFYTAIPQPQALQSIYLGPSKLPEQANGSRENDRQLSADPVSPSRAPINVLRLLIHLPANELTLIFRALPLSLPTLLRVLASTVLNLPVPSLQMIHTSPWIPILLRLPLDMIQRTT